MDLYTLRSVTLAAVVGLVVLLSTLALSPPASASPSAPTVATITPSFAPDVPGAKTSITFGASFSSGPGTVPAPLSKSVILLPAGIAQTLSWPTTNGCSRAHLQAHGASGCPPHSQVGVGSALLQWREGSSIASERATLQFFVGPTNGVPTLELLGEGQRPIRRRVVITEALFVISAPYSGGMEASIPSIPTRPGQPDASIASFSVTVGPWTRTVVSRENRAAAKRWGELELFVPRSCPAGGYPWAADFTYVGGATQEVTASAPCP